jgi:hypothetical protein
LEFLPSLALNVTYRCEAERVDLDTESSDVLLLELSRQVALDEGGLLIKRLATASLQTAPDWS